MARGDRNDPTAVIGRRIGACFIDVVLCGLAAAIPALLLADAYTFDRAGAGVDVEWVEGDLALFVRDTAIVLRGWEAAVTGGALLLAVLVVMVWLPGRRGWTPGDLAADLRVVRGDGSRPGVFRALVRTVLWVVDWLPVLGLVGYLSARATRRHQRVGDLVARTWVVDKHAAGRAVVEALPVEDEIVVEPEPEREPEPEPEPEPAPEPAVHTPPPGVPPDKPIWDKRHHRYVLWHSKSGRWLEHEESGWQPIDGEGG